MGVSNQMSKCDQCMAIVFDSDRDAHTEWHHGLLERLWRMDSQASDHATTLNQMSTLIADLVNLVKRMRG